MTQININVVGEPTDLPVLRIDGRPEAYTARLEPGRAIFTLDDAPANVGATIMYNGLHTVRVITPPPGTWEADLPPVKPPESTATIELRYVPTAPAITIDGAEFRVDGRPWLWRGATEFRLPHRLMEGEDIAPILADRAGFTILRSLAMKWPNTNPAWELNPRRADYWDGVHRYFEAVGNAGFALEWTVFADTKALMPDPGEQQRFWATTVELARQFPFVILELLNEVGHSTQAIDPARFSCPNGVIASHGSGGTDEDVVRPVWHYAAYHGRRLIHAHDSRGATNFSPFAYEEDWPKGCPFVEDEGPKPYEYSFDPAYARLMGRHARCGVGGTFHSNEGIQSVVFPPAVKACADAFCEVLS